MNAQAEMPRYRMRTRFHALKIAEVYINANGTVTITPAEKGYAPFVVDNLGHDTKDMRPGCYYISTPGAPRYIDGKSFTDKFEPDV